MAGIIELTKNTNNDIATALYPGMSYWPRKKTAKFSRTPNPEMEMGIRPAPKIKMDTISV